MSLGAIHNYSLNTAYNPRLTAQAGENEGFSSSMIKTGSVFAAIVATLGAFFIAGPMGAVIVGLLSGTGVFFLFNQCFDNQSPPPHSHLPPAPPTTPWYERLFSYVPTTQYMYNGGQSNTQGRGTQHTVAQGHDGAHVVPGGGGGRNRDGRAQHTVAHGHDGAHVVPGGGGRNPSPDRGGRGGGGAQHAVAQGPDGTHVVPRGGRRTG